MKITPLPLHRANESFTFREKKKKISEESSGIILLFFFAQKSMLIIACNFDRI